MEKLIKLIKEKVIREGMTVDETIKYVLELKSEINIKEFKRLKEELAMGYSEEVINKLAGDKLI